MLARKPPCRGDRSASPETHASGKCRIRVFGHNKLLNELLVSFLLAETADLCRCRRALGIRGGASGAQQERLRIDFIDSREPGSFARWLKDAESLPPSPERRVMVFFNVPEEAAETAEREAIACGVRGLFYRNDSRETIAKGIRNIIGGDIWFRRTALYREAMAGAVRSEPDAPAPPEWISRLTVREREILARLATGAGNQQIADALCVSLHTVKTHLYRVFRKIGVRSRHQAMLWGISHGIVAIPPPVTADWRGADSGGARNGPSR